MCQGAALHYWVGVLLPILVLLFGQRSLHGFIYGPGILAGWGAGLALVDVPVFQIKKSHPEREDLLTSIMGIWFFVWSPIWFIIVMSSR